MKLEINHILIRTTDLDAMISFFEQVLELKNGKRPPFSFAGAWLWADDKPLVHLSEADPVDKGQLDYLGGKKMNNDSGTGIIDHVAFSGQDYNNRRAILPHEILGTPVAKYSFTYGADWISPSTPCVRFNFAQKPLR